MTATASSEHSVNTLTNSLDRQIRSGHLAVDMAQRDIAIRLDMLIDALAVKKPVGLFGFGRKKLPVKGLYLWGGVGRGKSMLMDMFVQLASREHGIHVCRYHFHDFMTAVHAIVHKEREMGNADPTASVMEQLTKGADVICFDEMEVRDIADAMIIARVMDGYMRRGGVLVVTSNRHPDDLYLDGLQRERFLPFIAALKEYNAVVEMGGDTDWRQRVLDSVSGWYYPLDDKADDAMVAVLDQLTGGVEQQPVTVMIAGREVTIPAAANGVGMIDFSAICGVPLAAADYLVLAERFAGLLICHIPRLSDALQNEARRFIWLVDAFYDRKRFLIASAECDIDQIYTGNQWQAEFPRTVSRLGEMTRLMHRS
jgi:cell division protein ZapE